MAYSSRTKGSGKMFVLTWCTLVLSKSERLAIAGFSCPSNSRAAVRQRVCCSSAQRVCWRAWRNDGASPLYESMSEPAGWLWVGVQRLSSASALSSPRCSIVSNACTYDCGRRSSAGSVCLTEQKKHKSERWTRFNEKVLLACQGNGS